MENNKEIGRRECPNEVGVHVSLFKSYSDSTPIGTVSLADFLLQPTYRKEVEVVRGCRDPRRRRELKSRLPAITPSGTFSKRCNAGLIQHSGLICLDLDSHDNIHITDWEAVKSAISDLPGLWYAGLSVSGKGLFLLIKIAHPERHAEHFAALDRDLRSRGLVVDANCKDISRLRGASYDPNPLYFPDAEPYTDYLVPTRPTHGNTQTMPQNESLTALRVVRLVDTIERTGTDITGSYADWFAAGRAIASEFGERGRDYYHAVSCNHPKYNRTECDRQYTRCLGSCASTSIRTLFWLCKRHGITAG